MIFEVEKVVTERYPWLLPTALAKMILRVDNLSPDSYLV